MQKAIGPGPTSFLQNKQLKHYPANISATMSDISFEGFKKFDDSEENDGAAQAEGENTFGSEGEEERKEE